MRTPLSLKPVQPKYAIDAARKRGVVLPDIYYGKLQGIERATSFSVAGIASLDQLQQTLDSLTQALDTGKTFDTWKTEMLKAPDVLALPKHRLDNIFRTNIQGAYARGKCVHIEKNRERRPYLMYSAINDSRVRPSHFAMNGHVAKIDDPIWNTWTPPAGYRCRCTVISLTEKQANDRNARDQKKLDRNPDAAQARAAAIGQGPDQGWDYSPCEQGQDGIDRAIASRRQTYATQIEKLLAQIQTKAEGIRGHDDTSTWTKIGNQRGTNPGGIYEAPDGSRHYLKTYSDPNQSRSEVAAAAIHRMLGVDAPKARIVEFNGKTAVASPWREDYQRLSPEDMKAKKYRRDIGKIFAASVLTKNWDVVGLEYDNIVLTKEGKLAVVDTGGTFKFRAQGGEKPYNADIMEEVHGYRNPGTNPQSSDIFGAHFEADPWAEQAGTRPIIDITRTQVREAFEAAGFSPADVNELTDTLWARRNALIDRYDVRRKYVYKGFGKHLNKFKKWGTEVIQEGKTDHGSRYAVNPEVIRKDLMQKFNKYIESNFGRDKLSTLMSVFRDQWSKDSSSDGGGILKLWANDRFGVKIRYHDGTHQAHDRVARGVDFYGKMKGFTRDELFELLDVEYEFHQYYLRRLHKWDSFNLDRGMGIGEYKAGFKNGTFQPNAVVSTTTKAHVFHRSRRVRIETRVEDIVKTWYQGDNYMHFQESEAEYITIGRKRKAKGSGNSGRI